MKRGLFIVIEAPDGAGKDYQANALVRRLRNLYPGRRTVLTHEPWEGERYGRLIRGILQHRVLEVEPGDGKIIAEKFQLTYVRNRVRHHELVVRRALEEEAIVICVRERPSTYAYGAAFGVSMDLIHQWHEDFVEINPDLIIYLNTSARTCMERKAKCTGELELFERVDKIARIINSYHDAFSGNYFDCPVVYINNERSRKVVKEDVLRVVLGAISAHDGR